MRRTGLRKVSAKRARRRYDYEQAKAAAWLQQEKGDC